MKNKTLISQLTKKELELLTLLSKGLLYKEISCLQKISLNTVKKHASNAYCKLGVRNKTEAILLLFNNLKIV